MEKETNIYVWFEALKAVNITISYFLVLMPCSPMSRCQSFGETWVYAFRAKVN
jgi:hypothetical protein